MEMKHLCYYAGKRVCVCVWILAIDFKHKYEDKK